MANLEGEWLERNKHRAYPFIDGTYNFNAPWDSFEFDSFFLDAYLVYNASKASDKLDWFWYFQQLSLTTMALILRNSDNVDLALGAPVYSRVIDDYRMMSWFKEDVLNQDNSLAITLLINNNHLLLSETAVTISLSPSPAQFVARGQEEQTSRVNRVGVSKFAITIAGSADTLKIAEGNNVRLSVDPSTPLTSTRDLNVSSVRPDIFRLLIDAVPGAGTGKRDAGCNNAITDIITINKLFGKDGNFQFVSDDCYRIMRNVDGAYQGQDNELLIANDCQACCDCVDFSGMLENIRKIVNTALLAKSNWIAVRTAYEAVLATWNTKLACIGAGCRARLLVYSYTGWLITVQAWIGNVQDCVQEGADVKITFGGGNYVPAYVPGSGMLYNDQGTYVQTDPVQQPDGSWTMADNAAIRGSGYKLFVFSVRMLRTSDRVAGNTVDVTATITACNELPVALLSVVDLKSNTNKS